MQSHHRFHCQYSNVPLNSLLCFPSSEKLASDAKQNHPSQQIKFMLTFLCAVDCKDFMKRLLTADPVKRIAIPDALKHPWITEGNVLTLQSVAHLKSLLVNKLSKGRLAALRRRGRALKAMAGPSMTTMTTVVTITVGNHTIRSASSGGQIRFDPFQHKGVSGISE